MEKNMEKTILIGIEYFENLGREEKKNWKTTE